MENEELKLRFDDEANVYLPQIVANENIRKANENERVSNEIERKANEEIRKTNEANREEKFNTFMTDIEEDYKKISYVKEFKKTYITETKKENVFELPEPCTETSTVCVYVNGMKLNASEYIINERTVMLIKTLDVIGTVVEITVSKITTSLVEDYDNLKGQTGENGLSAYELALKNGFEGTEQEWLLSLKGNEIISDGVAEGESITITDAGNLPIESIMLKGKTYQETREGYNLLNLDKLTLFNSDKYISTKDYASTGAIAVKPNTTYSLIRKKSNPFHDGAYFIYDTNNSNKLTISATSVNNGDYNVAKFTTNSDTGYFGFYYGSNTTTYSSVDECISTNEIMLLEGDYTSNTIPKYEQYGASPSIEFPSPIQSVSGENKFIFNNKNWLQTGDIASENGITVTKLNETTYKFNGTCTTAGRLLATETFNIDSQSDYTLSCKLISGTLSGRMYTYMYEGNGSWERVTDACQINTSKLTEKKVSQTQLGIYFNTDVVANEAIVSFQFEKGDTATDHIEHQSQNYPISLGENEIFEDEYIYKLNDKWFKHTKFGIITNFSFGIDNPVPQGFYMGKKDMKTGGKIYSTVSKVKPTGTNYAKDEDWLKMDGNLIGQLYVDFKYIYINTTQTQINSILNDLGAKIYYELETPIETEITDSTLIAQLEALINAETYRYVTHVNTFNDSLKPTIKLGYNFAKGLISDEEIKQMNKDFDLINEHINEINNELSKILLACYPIGSYYWSENSTDPSTLFGGTWERVKDKFLYAIGDTGTAGESGGSQISTTVTHVDGQQAGLGIPSGAYSGKILVANDESVMNQKEVLPVHEKAYCWKRID